MSVILQTRYRDVPVEEVAKCNKNFGVAWFTAKHWKKYRGKGCAVRTPPLPDRKCLRGEPLFEHEKSPCDGYQIVVCSHIAEIGD